MADFSMPNAFAQNHLNRIMKKTEKFKIIHVFARTIPFCTNACT